MWLMVAHETSKGRCLLPKPFLYRESYLVEQIIRITHYLVEQFNQIENYLAEHLILKNDILFNDYFLTFLALLKEELHMQVYANMRV